MSTRARKDRKRAGEPFQHPVKVGTPPHERQYVTALVPGAASTKTQGHTLRRSAKKVERFLKRWNRSEASD